MIRQLAQFKKEQFLYKVVMNEQWTKFVNSKQRYIKGFDNDKKFIHLSVQCQVYDVILNKYADKLYKGQKGSTIAINKDVLDALSLLCIDINNTDKIKWELKSSLTEPGKEYFPHLYSVIDIKVNNDKVPYVKWVKSLNDIIFY